MNLRIVKNIKKAGGGYIHILIHREPSISSQELKSILSSYKKEFLLERISEYLFYVFERDIQNSLNHIQITPGIFNSILLYCDGKKDIISDQEFDFILNEIISNFKYGKHDNSESIKSSFLPTLHMRIFRHGEEVILIIARMKRIFKLIEKEDKEMSFEKIIGIPLEKIVLLLTTFYYREPGEVQGSDFFLRLIEEIGFSDLERKCFDEIINNDLSIRSENLEEEITELRKHCEKENTFTFEQYTIFESKPFLEIGDKSITTSPHYILNSMADLLTKLYINHYSPKKNNKATQILGKVFEDYIIGLLRTHLKGFIREPSFPENEGNKGVDLVRVKKNKIPLFLEICKAVTHQRLIKNYSEERYEEFCEDKIIPKFKQIFNWINKHKFKFNGVDLEKELKRIQFIVCLIKTPPIIYLDRNFNILMEMLNKKWKAITGMECSLRDANIYVFSSEELELALGFAKKRRMPLEKIFFQFKKHMRNAHHVLRSPERPKMKNSSFKAWLYEKYGKGLSRPDVIPLELKKEFDEIFPRLT